MSDPDKNVEKNTIKVEPSTLFVIVFLLLLIPLLVTGFFSL
jgi:hypothetical protein